MGRFAVGMRGGGGEAGCVGDGARHGEVEWDGCVRGNNQCRRRKWSLVAFDGRIEGGWPEEGSGSSGIGEEF